MEKQELTHTHEYLKIKFQNTIINCKQRFNAFFLHRYHFHESWSNLSSLNFEMAVI